MIILGLTGGIATGKSTTSMIFREMDIPVHDADATVHGLMASNGSATTAIASRFGAEVIAADGSVDRQARAKPCLVMMNFVVTLKLFCIRWLRLIAISFWHSIDSLAQPSWFWMYPFCLKQGVTLYVI